MLDDSINLDDLEDMEDCSIKEPYPEDSAIIRCGRYLSTRARRNNIENRIASGESVSFDLSIIEDDISDDQKQYINLLSVGMSSIKACETMNIDIFLPTLWDKTLDKDCTYMQCMSLIKEKQADSLEDHVWDQALHNGKATILKMFALKARKDEYKDNALPQTNVQTNIHVSIADANGNLRPYTVSTTPGATEEVKRG